MLLLFFLVALVCTSVLLAAVALLTGHAEAVGSQRWAQAATQVFSFVVPVVAMTLLYYRGCQREYYRLYFDGRKWLAGLEGIVVLLLLMPAIDALSVWNEGWRLPEAIEGMLRSMQEASETIVGAWMSDASVGGLLLNLLVVALVPAVCEEVLFRAGMQNLLHRWLKNKHVAVWLTAIVFSSFHMEVYAFMPRLLMGALLGYVYVYGGSLLCNTMVHFFNNAFVVVAYWIGARGWADINPDEPTLMPVLLTVACTLAAVGLFYACFVMPRHDKTKTEALNG